MQSSLLLLLWGCRPPPDAPQNLDDLMSYLFEHTRDERPDAMIAGIENLSLWLESHLEETFDGYRVTNLSSESVANLDDRTHNLDGQVGAVFLINKAPNPWLTTDIPQYDFIKSSLKVINKAHDWTN